MRLGRPALRAGSAALLGARDARCAHSGTQAFDRDTAVVHPRSIPSPRFPRGAAGGLGWGRFPGRWGAQAGAWAFLPQAGARPFL